MSVCLFWWIDMDPLQPTSLSGTAMRLLLNHPVAAGASSEPDSSPSVDIAEVDVSFAGFAGESHSGLTRPSCVRVKKQYPFGTTIRNTRQISIVSEEELQTIASLLEIPSIDPGWLFANLVIKGLPDFSQIPPSTRLIFEHGVSLVIDMENAPCRYPGDMIDRHHPGVGRYFAKRARGLRGVTAWVEREGRLSAGEGFKVHAPAQRAYPHF